MMMAIGGGEGMVQIVGGRVVITQSTALGAVECIWHCKMTTALLRTIIITTTPSTGHRTKRDGVLHINNIIPFIDRLAILNV